MTEKLKIPDKWKIKWHSFWSDWHLVKHFYYGSSRHLRKHDKHCNKLMELGLTEDEIEQYVQPEIESDTSSSTRRFKFQLKFKHLLNKVKAQKT